jgi:N,N'-diacetyllegionaminate synthase
MNDKKVKIVAEAGVNHNGSLKQAHNLIDKASEIEADAIKFQTFITEKNISKNTPLAGHHKANLKEIISHYDLIKRLELPLDNFRELKEHAEENKLEFISTPYDILSAQYLIDLKVDLIKIASSEMTNLPLLEVISNSNIPIILSTGMSNIDEVIDSINFIYTKHKNITVLKCTSNYPSSYESINLKSIETLKNIFPKLEVGFSDHCEGPEASILSLAYNVKIIEKHFTLNKNDWGPDHKASLEPDEFKEFIRNIRVAEKTLGSNNWDIQKEEIPQKNTMRKGTYLNQNVEKGDIITLDMVDFLRPLGSITPKNFFLRFKNNPIKSNFLKGHQLSEVDFE